MAKKAAAQKQFKLSPAMTTQLRNLVVKANNAAAIASKEQDIFADFLGYTATEVGAPLDGSFAINATFTAFIPRAEAEAEFKAAQQQQKQPKPRAKKAENNVESSGKS